ncbi:MAG: OB-fold nucleic acid binding domain-containing protein, partial [Chloroflexota bacterium]
TLGYAVRKKKRDVLQAQKSKFVERAAERGVPPNIIDAVFKAFEPFERYGFNKAHATCYGLIAYQTAYLKANYTVEYMTSVLTAVRDSADKVAAAIAECRRLGIEVRPPNVHTSGLDFSVEGDAIRFGLLAIKNVGHGAIESIIQQRTEVGPFRSLADFSARVDLRLVNRRVLESLVKVGALNELGHPAQLLLALDDALASGQAAQRDRLTGQVSLFDATDDSSPLERPLPDGITEAAPRERLRWEKELLGLYLSDHPLGELAGVIGEYVNAYSGEMGEELDQQRVCVGGVVTGTRRVITKSRSTMGVATLEDLQGTMEVIVFPKVFELTEQTWAEDAILLVAGRVDHKGDETVLLADAVWTWEEATAMGSVAFARELARTDRGRRGGGRQPYAAAGVGGNGHANGNGAAGGYGAARPVAVGPGAGQGSAAEGPRVVRTVPLVSPLRGVEVSGTIDVAFAAVAERPALQSAPVMAADDEAPLPEEVVAELISAEQLPTEPVQAAAGKSLHLTFMPGAAEEVEAAFKVLREIVHERPGETPLVLHIPAGGGRVQRMELRVGVAYDAELIALINRRLGQRFVRVNLA